MTTDPPPHPTVVWVMVNGVTQPRTHWTYLLSQDEPGRSRDVDSHDRPVPSDRLCYSYTELCVWLQTYGFTPPPPDYFTPTPEELDRGAESIVRPVTRRR
jgi:hypothetical protein